MTSRTTGQLHSSEQPKTFSQENALPGNRWHVIPMANVIIPKPPSTSEPNVTQQTSTKTIFLAQKVHREETQHSSSSSELDQSSNQISTSADSDDPLCMGIYEGDGSIPVRFRCPRTLQSYATCCTGLWQLQLTPRTLEPSTCLSS